MEKKSYDGLLSAILIIGFMVISVGFGYYAPKVEADEEEVVEETEVVEEDATVEKTNLLTNEEALEIGNKLYEYATENNGLSNNLGDIFYSDEFNSTSTKQYELIEKMISEAIKIKANFTDDFVYYTSTDDNEAAYDFANYVMPASRGSHGDFMNTELTVKSINESIIVFNATSNYCLYFQQAVDTNQMSLCEDKNNLSQKVNEFIIQKVDGTWKIKQFTLAY